MSGYLDRFNPYHHHPPPQQQQQGGDQYPPYGQPQQGGSQYPPYEQQQQYGGSQYPPYGHQAPPPPQHYSPYPLSRIDRVDVTVYGGTVPDRDMFSKSDPYVIIKCGRFHSKRTKTIKNNNNPVWNETHSIDTKGFLGGEGSDIVIELWDHDYLTRDDFLGSITIPLEDLRQGPKEGVYALHQGKRKHKGELRLLLTPHGH
ncbi:C2 domain-containing protein [Blastocladiella britannica]|nr:C2 domain-containing protein [Blastocladiella britannica]